MILPKQATTEVLIEYAVTLELMDDYKEVLTLISRIEQRINSAEDLGNYGWLLSNLGKYDDGVKYVIKAIDKAPGLRQWQRALALILSEDGKIADALNRAQELTEMNPDDSEIWATCSMIESLAGNYDSAALKCGRRAVELNPDGPFENISLAFALSGCGDHKGAVDELQKIGGEKDDLYYRSLGHCQILAGDSAFAVESLKSAVEPYKACETSQNAGTLWRSTAS